MAEGELLKLEPLLVAYTCAWQVYEFYPMSLKVQESW